MEEISTNLRDEVELQLAIVQFISQCLKKRNWPLIKKLMPAIQTLFSVFKGVASFYPFEQSLEPQIWSEKSSAKCLSNVLTGFELIYERNRSLFESLAVLESIHEPLTHLMRYAKNLDTMQKAMSIISGLCAARKVQVRRFIDLDILTIIKIQLQNQIIMQRCCDFMESNVILGIFTETCVALSNIACDRTPGVIDQLILSQVYS